MREKGRKLDSATHMAYTGIEADRYTDRMTKQ